MNLPSSLYAKWRFALKPASWPKLLVPAVFGQALGAAHLGRLDLMPALVGLALSFLLLAAIVLLNDYGDRDVDALKRRMYPQSSPKTIPDGVLPAHHLLFAGIGISALFIGGAFWAETWANRPGFGIAGTLAFLLFAAYSLPPVRLNYRGGGELLEMLGVGLVLPWLNAYLQGGLGTSLPWFPRPGMLLSAIMVLALASAIASGLGDERSDRRGGKRTFTTMFGNVASRRVIEALVPLAVGALGLAAFFSEHIPPLTVVPPSLLILWRWTRLRKLSEDAVTGAFAAQAAYKFELHAAIWRGTELLAATVLGYRLFIGS